MLATAVFLRVYFLATFGLALKSVELVGELADVVLVASHLILVPRHLFRARGGA
jgi:hypothetical protein